MVAAIQTGKHEPTDVLERIRSQFEADEPDIHAFIPEDNRWDRLGRELSTIESETPLHGIPIGVKDIFHVDGFETHAGATVPPTELQGPEASIVQRLIENGALILGKTVTAEFAYFAPGPTRNPHDLSRTPGGSSSGSAAAVSAGMCPLALGTQTAGSVIRPAAFCGIVGLKPSGDRLPTNGIIPFSPSLDQVGFFTADVESARFAAATLFETWSAPTYTRSPRIGIPARAYIEQASTATVQRFQQHCEQLEAAGFNLIEIPDCPNDIEWVNDQHETLMEAEGARTHRKWYDEYPEQYSDTLTALIERGRTISENSLSSAQSAQDEFGSEIERAMASAGVDVLISPAAPGIAPTGLNDTGDPIMNVPWTFAGVPAITLPVGSIDGLPLGLQCVARYGNDERLLAWAREIAAVY